MADAMIFKPGDLPECCTETFVSKPRVTGCTCGMQKGQNLFCIRFLCVQTLYLIQERVFVFVAKNMFLTYIFKNTGASPKIKRDRKPVRGGNMKRRIVAVVLATVLGAVCITGCGNTQETVESTAQVSTEAQATQATETAATESTEDADQAAADEVAALIDAIYVQERTENTDKQCADAKAAWDALTDAQKELVEGENADPDYFGRDTGDASKDDPRNQEEIGENEILVVSFGTSFNDSRVADIKGIEDAIAAANPDWSVRRAFTAQIIINHIQARDDEHIDNMDQALDRAVANGVKNLVVQPTHLMHGAEYDELMEAVEAYKDQFASVKVAEPVR